jgi:RNA polymerase sigma-70 factor (ECF subfamily)
MKHTNFLKTGEQFSDGEVIAQILSERVAMFEILIRRYNPYLYKTARAYGYRHDDAEDLMQETYISVYQNLAKFEARSTFKTWIIRIMLNQCYHKAQKHSFKKEMAVEEFSNISSEPMFMSENRSDTGASVLNRELSRIIESSLEKLPEDYRMTFTLRELTGLNVAETAELTNTTTANVKVRLNRAKVMLRKEIEKVYSADEIYEFNLIYCDKIVDNVMKRISEMNAGGNI